MRFEAIFEKKGHRREIHFTEREFKLFIDNFTEYLCPT